MTAGLELVEVLRHTIVGIVRQDGPDLPSRQLAVLLICSLENDEHTVRGLAGRLRVTGPVITQIADRLQELGLTERAPDHRDRRSILIVPTASGRAFVNALGTMMEQAAQQPPTKPAVEPRRKRRLEGARLQG